LIEQGQSAHLALEFIPGKDLLKIMEATNNRPFSIDQVIDWTKAICDVLTHMHTQSPPLVHRDLKPDNIMLARGRDGGDLVKVVDFGIAKVASSEQQKVTKTGSIIGTPDYMSPEQLAGDPLDARSDVYALGLVAFAMLAGTLPFPSDSAQEALVMRLTERPRTLAEARPDVPWPAGMQAALDHALERDSSRRCQSALEFARDVALAAAGMPDAVDRLGVTQLMSAPPAPLALPATRVSAGVARDAITSSSKQPSRVSMLGGIAAVVVLAGLGYAMTRGRTADPSTPPTNADPMSRSVPQPSTVAALPSTAKAASGDVDKLLDSLEDRAKTDKPAAREVLRRLSALTPTLIASGDSVHAELARFDAMLTLEDAAAACRSLAAVRDRAAGTSYQSRVNGKLEACP
ncbi:MAG: serine/threonine protein kinase, partial [Gemmatimonadales bacterium]